MGIKRRLNCQYWLAITLLLCSFAATAQVAPDAALIDTALVMAPRVVAAVLQKPDTLAGLREDIAPISVYVNSVMNDTGAIYYYASIKFPGAYETRIEEEENRTTHMFFRYWNVILAREYNVKSLDQGRIPELATNLIAALERLYPTLVKAQRIDTLAGTSRPIKRYFSLTQPGSYIIGVETWYDKVGGRNTARLYITTPGRKRQ